MGSENRSDRLVIYNDGRNYDHDEVRCELMSELDALTKAVGESRTCCVCIGHNCPDARAERRKHPARL